MDDDGHLARFQSSEPRLRALAFRMLGSRDEADDALQETWLRLDGTNAEIQNVDGWLTTVLARVCLDRLRARGRREVPTEAVDDSARTSPDDDPAEDVVMADSVGAALLVVLEFLPPSERVAFVLHDVFAVPFDEIAEILDRSPDATRQLASRARRRVQGASAGTNVDPARHRDVVRAFLRAAQGDDFETLVQLLDPDVVLRPDAAALAMGSMKETHGADAVATLMAGGAKGASLAIIDGITGLVWAPGGSIRGVIEFRVVDGRIRTLSVVGDRDRIGEFDIVTIED